MDSTHWVRIIEAVREAYDDHDGFVICHGTDTMATQVPYEGSHLETYEVGRRITGSFSVLETRDMTLEATVAKLMWILGEEGQKWEEIRTRFYEPVAMDRLVE